MGNGGANSGATVAPTPRKNVLRGIDFLNISMAGGPPGLKR